MRRLAFGGARAGMRLKALRFALIRQPGRVACYARRLAIGFRAGNHALPVPLDASRAMLALTHALPATA